MNAKMCKDLGSESHNRELSVKRKMVKKARDHGRRHHCYNSWKLVSYSVVTYRFDSVPNAHDQFAIFFHLVDKLHGQHAAVKSLAELLRSSIQSPTKPVTLNTQTQ